jgi:NAD(P)-dependent dehydrogenase (short-subunit alcohol dehydrogenase family)
MNNRHVIIAGAADSVGLVTAEAFAHAGAAVHVLDCNAEALRRALQRVPEITGTVGDVGNSADVARAVADAQARMGYVDALVNFVGIAGPRAPIEDITDEDWHASVQVNATGAFYLMRAVIPGMKQRRSGVIVNISSASTRSGLPCRTPYVTSKCALEGLTRNAARELGPYNVRCNAVLPGAINNRRLDLVIERVAAARGVSPAEQEASLLRYISMRSKVEPQEIADSVLFLCSEQARHITGQLLEVSGGHEWEE